MISTLTIVRIAWRALARNKMRSSLTLLGIVIGVGAVITMVSLGQAAQRLVEEQIASVGPNLLFVSPGSRTAGGAQMGAGFSATLTDDDIEAIVREVPIVTAATPMVTTRGQIIFGNQNWSTRVEGTNERAPEIRAWAVARGEFFTIADAVLSEAPLVFVASLPASFAFCSLCFSASAASSRSCTARACS